MKSPSRFHGVGRFDVASGEMKDHTAPGQTYTEVFSWLWCVWLKRTRQLRRLRRQCLTVTGLTRFSRQFPSRFFDVGIAEAHAVTFAAGLAAAGLKPYVAVYSSFLQRAYDQIVHDVCIQSLPVTFCIDRAGLVGADGETHQGILDLSYMNTIPNMASLLRKINMNFMMSCVFRSILTAAGHSISERRSL